MKRSVLSALITGSLLLAGSDLAAQNAAPGDKLLKPALRQEKEPGTSAPALKFQAANTESESKPIIPGEYKPAGSKAAPADPMPEPKPNLQAAPFMKENRTAGKQQQ